MIQRTRLEFLAPGWKFLPACQREFSPVGGNALELRQLSISGPAQRAYRRIDCVTLCNKFFDIAEQGEQSATPAWLRS